MVNADNANVIELYRDVDTYNSAFNHNASDKMQLIGLGELPPPAQCFVCGNGSCEAGYVNLGVWAEFVGNLLVCTPCLVQAAELAGCLAPIIRTTMEQHIANLQKYSRELEDKVASQDEQLRSYRSVINNLHGVDSGAVNNAITQPPSGNNDLGESVVSGTSGESELIESSDERGPDDLSDSTAEHSEDSKPQRSLIEL